MLKKTKFIYACLLIILFGALIIDKTTKNEVHYLYYAYICIFLALSVYLIIRGLRYKIDTNLYFGLILTISPTIQLLMLKNIAGYQYYLIAVFGILALSSLVVSIYFKDKNHKRLFFVFLGEMAIFTLPIYLTKILIWYLIIIAISWFILSNIVCSIYFKRLKR